MGLKSFSLIFLTSLIGVTTSQNLYYKGLYLASSSAASVMFNLVPAITFVMAVIFGLEKVNIRSMRSISKIVGTVLCVSGAVAMALFKGSKLLNVELLPSKYVLKAEGDNWLLGCLLLFGSSFCWSCWLILQVAITAIYPDQLSLTAWMCFMTTLQSMVIALFSAPNLDDWKMTTYLELACCLYSAGYYRIRGYVLRTSLVYSKKRSSLFCNVPTTKHSDSCHLTSVFMHEQIYIGSVIGGVSIILGLYAVLWGKAKEIEEKATLVSQKDQTQVVLVLVDGLSDHTSCKNDMDEPLLLKKVGTS